MLLTNDLIHHLQDNGISVEEEQIQELRNIGYYHGYKGYRFIRTPNQRIHFNSLNEIIALNNFDMHLKSAIYPKVMFIENALKSYVIESVLDDCHCEYLDTVFNKSITYYKSKVPGSYQYHKEYEKRMKLNGKINNSLLRDYCHNIKTVNHFFDSDRSIPIWAVFESLTLGEFGNCFSCSNLNVKRKTSSLLKLPSNLDVDGKLTQFVIYTIKDLRNAVAHNGVIFDTRFRSSTINGRLTSLLETEIGVSGIDFKYIYSYIILITYILIKMNVSKVECKQFVSSFIYYTDTLRNNIDRNICNKILGTHQQSHLRQLQSFIESSN